MMKIAIGIAISLLSATMVFAQQLQFPFEEECYRKIEENPENYKIAHTFTVCEKALESGSPGAAYQVAMAWGFAGNYQKEEQFYRVAAERRSIASYLALGHSISIKKGKLYEAAYWYQRYIQAKGKSWGYAASRLADLFDKVGDNTQAEYWREYCAKSKYTGCTK